MPDLIEKKWLFGSRLRYHYVDTIGNVPPKRIEATDLKFGDILLCVGKCSLKTAFLEWSTNGAFVHAALVGPGISVHEARFGGVVERSIKKFIDAYEYVAVLRSTLNSDQIASLKRYLDNTRNNRYGYIQALRAGIAGGMLARSQRKGLLARLSREDSCICSAYVRGALAECGIWAIDANADITTPTDIANVSHFKIVGILSKVWPPKFHRQDTAMTLERWSPD